MQDWRPYAKIAYPACFMECAESWCWGSMSILAGLLPNPARTVSSLSIAFSLFTAMFFVYLSQGLACSTRCGFAPLLTKTCFAPLTKFQQPLHGQTGAG